MEIATKVCLGCNQELSFLEYTKAKLGKFGLRSKCKNCRAKEAIDYNSIHKETVSARGKRYREERAKQISAQRAIHTAQNKERLAEYQKQWRLANPGKSNARTARRRAARRKAIPKWLTKEHYLETEAKYIEAVNKSKETGIPHEVDHEIPLRGDNVCGLHVPWNLKVITKSENRKKSKKFIS